MGNAFLYGNGGGVGLNFKVIGGTTEPSNPRENVIWVNTNQKITSWFFTATEPTNPANGTVWFVTGASSSAEFNALKKNGIQVYAISAKQYVSGAWYDKTVKLYRDGKWVGLLAYLYNSGDECNNLTGGWEFAMKRYAAGITAQDSACTYERNEDHLYIHKHGVGMGNVMYAKNPINLTSYSSLVFKGNMDDGGGGGYADRVRLCVWSSLEGHSTDNIVAQLTGNSNGGTINITGLTGEFYVGFLVYGDASVTLRKMYLA